MDEALGNQEATAVMEERDDMVWARLEVVAMKRRYI